MIGKTILHYKIIEKLGEGGMGVVYKAKDTKLERLVALKFLSSSAIGTKEEKERFKREAKAAASLNHPNIGHIYAIDETDDKAFIVMEFIEGKTLEEMVDAPLPIEKAINYATQISAGLHVAHEKGVIHRDIKSANIMVTPSDQIKIMDFGLAKISNRTKVTIQGSTLGTAGYMSPEQAGGETVDNRSDIWSLGVILYEMISGQMPFKGDYEQAVVFSILNEDPEPLTSVRTNVPLELERIATKLLQKDPALRYQNVVEVPADLKAISVVGGSSTTISRISSPQTAIKSVPSQPKVSILPWIIAGVMTLLAVAFIIAPWESKPDLPGPIRFSLSLPSSELMDIVVYSSVAISPNGSKMVYRANNQLVLRTMDRLEPVPIPGTEEGGSPFFSPDGQWLGFFSKGKLKKLSLSGGAPLVLADATDNRGASWGKDGTIVFTPSTTVGIMRIPETGGAVQEITIPDTARNERTHRWPHLLPDGKTVLFTVGTMDSPDYYEDAIITALNLETGVRKDIIRGASTVKYAQSGHLIYSRSGVLYSIPFDPDNLEVTGTPIPVLEGLNGDPTSGAMHYDISKNGTLAYIPGQIEGANRLIVLADHDGNITPLPCPVAAYTEPRISPDGKKVAIVVGSGKDFDIWVYDMERETLSRLTFGGTNRTPTWSPNSKDLAYYFNRGGKTGVYMKKANGSGDEEVLFTGPGRTYVQCWSRDNSVMIMDHAVAGMQSNLLVLPLQEDSEPYDFLATEFDEYMATLSPDGKWLAYISNESGVYQVYVQPFPKGGGKWQISTNGGLEPRWSPDGKRLYYTSGGRMMVVPITPGSTFSAGHAELLFNGYWALPVDSGISYDISPDDQYFVTTRPEQVTSFQQVNIVLNWFTEINASFSVNK
jgi:serine/threonine-protein kinase